MTLLGFADTNHNFHSRDKMRFVSETPEEFPLKLQ